MTIIQKLRMGEEVSFYQGEPVVEGSHINHTQSEVDLTVSESMTLSAVVFEHE